MVNELNEHLSKGKDYSYTFSNDGNIILTKNNDSGHIHHHRLKTKIKVEQ